MAADARLGDGAAELVRRHGGGAQASAERDQGLGTVRIGFAGIDDLAFRRGQEVDGQGGGDDVVDQVHAGDIQARADPFTFDTVGMVGHFEDAVAFPAADRQGGAQQVRMAVVGQEGADIAVEVVQAHADTDDRRRRTASRRAQRHAHAVVGAEIDIKDLCGHAIPTPGSFICIKWGQDSRRCSRGRFALRYIFIALHPFLRAFPFPGIAREWKAPLFRMTS